MKKIIFIGAMLFFLPNTFILAQDSICKRDLLFAVFKTALTLDTSQVTIDSVIVMISPDYGKIWLPGDSVGFTFIRKDGSWRFLVDVEISEKVAKINPCLLLGVLKKLKTLQKK